MLTLGVVLEVLWTLPAGTAASTGAAADGDTAGAAALSSFSFVLRVSLFDSFES